MDAKLSKTLSVPHTCSPKKNEGYEGFWLPAKQKTDVPTFSLISAVHPHPTNPIAWVQVAWPNPLGTVFFDNAEFKKEPPWPGKTKNIKNNTHGFDGVRGIQWVQFKCEITLGSTSLPENKKVQGWVLSLNGGYWVNQLTMWVSHHRFWLTCGRSELTWFYFPSTECWATTCDLSLRITAGAATHTRKMAGSVLEADRKLAEATRDKASDPGVSSGPCLISSRSEPWPWVPGYKDPIAIPRCWWGYDPTYFSEGRTSRQVMSRVEITFF